MGGADGGACPGRIALTVDDGAPVSLTSRCGAGGPANGSAVTNRRDRGPDIVIIQGCVTAAPGSLRVDITALGGGAPGTYMQLNAEYTDASGSVLFGVGTLTIDTWGPVGGTIDGTFSLTASGHALAGMFSVCHTPDG
jgi:hypothetical protein